MGAFFSILNASTATAKSPSPAPLLSPVPDEPGLWVFFPSESDSAVTLPLASVNARIDVHDIAARVALEQTFSNPNDVECEEACYNFKLEEGVVVCAFEARIGESCIHGLVKEALEARQEYKEAKEEGRTAYLMEQAASKNVFSLRLGNVPPRVSVTVVITFACILQEVSGLPKDGSEVLRLRLSADCLVPAKFVTRHAPRRTDEMDLSSLDAKQFRREHAKRLKLQPKSIPSPVTIHPTATSPVSTSPASTSTSPAPTSPASTSPASTSTASASTSTASASTSTASASTSTASAAFTENATSPASADVVVETPRVAVNIAVTIQACGTIMQLESPGSNLPGNSEAPSQQCSFEDKQGHMEWQWRPPLSQHSPPPVQGFELRIRSLRVIHPVVMAERLCVKQVASEERDSPQGKEDYALLLSFHPDVHTYENTSTPRLNSEVIFVLDRSGSMSGQRMENMKRTLSQVLSLLASSSSPSSSSPSSSPSSSSPSASSGVHFNFVGFGSHHALLWPESRPVNEASLSLAHAYVSDELQANMGGTELLRPLAEVLEKEVHEGSARQIFLLTDGEVDPAQQARVLTLLRSEANTTRLFAFGLGNELFGNDFIRRIAQASHGQPSFISDKEDMCAIVHSQVREALTPAMTKMSLFWDGLEAIEVPFRLRPAHHGEAYRVFALLSVLPQQIDRIHRIVLSGRLPGGFTKRFVMELCLREHLNRSGSKGCGITQLAAREMSRDIEENGSALQVPYPECYLPVLRSFFLDELAALVMEYCSGEGLVPDPAVAQRELVRLGTTFQIITSATSFVCVDPSRVVAPASSSARKVRQPTKSEYRPPPRPKKTYWSSLYSPMFCKRETRCLMLGLDGAGKTTILYQLKLGESVTTIPTIGFNVETVEFGGISLTMWDVGGQDKIRPLWRHYYQNTQCLVFVVDSTDIGRFPQARKALQELQAEPELRDASLLILANKQDCRGACSVFQVGCELGMSEWRTDGWFIQGCSAERGSGLAPGLGWLANKLIGR